MNSAFLVRIPEIIGIIMIVKWSVQCALWYRDVRMKGETFFGAVSAYVSEKIKSIRS